MPWTPGHYKTDRTAKNVKLEKNVCHCCNRLNKKCKVMLAQADKDLKEELKDHHHGTT